jgi:hypothetical protein
MRRHTSSNGGEFIPAAPSPAPSRHQLIDRARRLGGQLAQALEEDGGGRWLGQRITESPIGHASSSIQSTPTS